MTRRSQRERQQMLADIRQMLSVAIDDIIQDLDDRADVYAGHVVELVSERDAAMAGAERLAKAVTARGYEIDRLMAELEQAVEGRAEAERWAKHWRTVLDAARNCATDKHNRIVAMHGQIRALDGFGRTVRDILGCDPDAELASVSQFLFRRVEIWRQNEESLEAHEQSLAASRKARAELARRLDDTEQLLADEKAAVARLQAEVNTLKHELAKPAVTTAAQRMEAGSAVSPRTGPASNPLRPLAITPMAALILELHGKGNNAQRIKNIINNRLEPAMWMNEVGVAAVLELLIGEAA